MDRDRAFLGPNPLKHLASPWGHGPGGNYLLRERMSARNGAWLPTQMLSLELPRVKWLLPSTVLTSCPGELCPCLLLAPNLLLHGPAPSPSLTPCLEPLILEKTVW